MDNYFDDLDYADVEHLARMVEIDRTQNAKLQTFKKTSVKGMVMKLDVPGLLELFTDDGHRVEALRHILRRTEMLDERVVKKIMGTFVDPKEYAADILDCTSKNLPCEQAPGIVERIRKQHNLDEDEGKLSLTINDFTFTNLRPTDRIANLKVHGKRITIKLDAGKLEVKYGRSSFTADFVDDEMEIQVETGGTIQAFNNAPEGR